MHHSNLTWHISETLAESATALDRLRQNPATLALIATAAEKLAATAKQGGRIYSFGNGGSMCDAMHFAEELSGRFRKNRPAIAAIAISDPSHISCVGNDFGYEEVFSRFLQGFAQPGDIALGISTSGSSKNVIAGLKAAKEKGAFTIALTGKEQCPIKDVADLMIATPGGEFADRVQELHIKVIHIFIELIERQLFPANY